GDYSEYEVLFSAFDDFLATGFESEKSSEEWYAFFKDHFTKANDFFERTHTNIESAQRYVLRQPIPTAILDGRDEMLASNDLFERKFNTQSVNLINDLRLNPAWQDLNALRQGDIAGPLLFNIAASEDAIDMIIATRVEVLDEKLNRPVYRIALRSAQSVWSPGIETLLKNAYDLSDAETDIIKSIFTCGDLKKVADQRNRSIRTIRTQLSSIYSKMNISGQIQLVILIASLLQLANLEEADRLSKATIHSDVEVQSISIGNRKLSYLHYGASNGIPILLLNTSLPPEMTDRFVDFCADNNLQIIAPFKPGSEQTTNRPTDIGPTDLVSDYMEALKSLNIEKAVIAGTASGGLYALEFANSFPNAVEGVVLIDTGVPYTSLSEMKKLPRSIRRTMIAGRYMPKILYAPHRIVAANFKGSLKGEARVIDYFFADSPRDKDLVKTETKFYQLTRRIISYSFDDVDRLVSDVCRWASDWSSLLKTVSKKQKVCFVHGTDNLMFPIKAIVTFCDENPNANIIQAEDEGQLQIYQRPERLRDAINRLNS
ncbi:MAG: alpha/beta hydrolase, partial [Pseudomonadota bacterium]